MGPGIEVARKTALAYGAVCKPLCQELGLPQTAFDILMFLGNNPTYKTASDIVEIRHIKANLVSVHVDRLVREGLSGTEARSGGPAENGAAAYGTGGAGGGSGQGSANPVF